MLKVSEKILEVILGFIFCSFAVMAIGGLVGIIIMEVCK